MLITIAIIGLVLTALLGGTLLLYVFSNKETPKGLAIIHGTFAIFSLTVLFLAALLTRNNYMWGFLGFFVLVALGGLFLFFKDMTNKIPKSVTLIHGTLAIIGLVSLVIFSFSLFNM